MKPATTDNERKVLELLSEGTHPLVDLMAVCGYVAIKTRRVSESLF